MLRDLISDVEGENPSVLAMRVTFNYGTLRVL